MQSAHTIFADSPPDPRSYAAMGVAAEMMLVAALLERGHKVALPVVDDDGVDLIVDYRKLVQVKTSASRDVNDLLVVELRGGASKTTGLRTGLDVVAVFDREYGSWYFVPAAEVTTNRLRLSFTSRYLNNWSAFQCGV